MSTRVPILTARLEEFVNSTEPSLACWKVMQSWDDDRVFVYNYLLSATVVITGNSLTRAQRIAELLNRIYKNA